MHLAYFTRVCSNSTKHFLFTSGWTRWMTVQSQQDYDVVIVGAGMVGAGLASSLSADPMTKEMKIALLDAKMPKKVDFNALDDIPEMRVSTLTPASGQLIEKCGAWENLAPPNSASIEDMQVWDYGSSGCLRWSAHQVQQQNMGVVAENSLIQSAFLKTLEGKKNIEFICPAQIQSMKLPNCLRTGEYMDSDLASLKLSNGLHLRSRLVVGADGAASRIRQMAGLHSSGHDYGQRGLVSTVETDKKDFTAWQRFLPTGPFALLPVRNNLFNVVWSTTAQMAEAVESADLSTAVHAFNEALTGGPQNDPVLGRFTPDLSGIQTPPQITRIAGNKPRSFPLRRQLAHNFVSSRLALVGDAYRVIHPLAGQGVNLGLSDVEQLTKALNNAVSTGQDIGNHLMLRSEYESPRRLESQVMMTALDTIRKLFQVQNSPFQKMRGVGMEALNQVRPLKNEIMLYAMGLKPARSHLPFTS